MNKVKRSRKTSCAVFATIRLLEKAHIAFDIKRTRPDSLTVIATVVGERIEIDIEKICHRFTMLSQRFEIVLVEGVGGWLVPIAPNFFVSDLATRLNLPVAIVTENRLGCLNHVLLTCESVRNRGFSCAGIIFNRADAAGDLAQTTNEGELRRLLPDTVVLPIAENGVQTPAKWAQLFAQNLRNGDVFRKLTQL